MLRVHVVGQGTSMPPVEPRDFLLRHDTWNDWWEYETLYKVSYVNDNGSVRTLGTTKIASIPMADKSPDLPDPLGQLDNSHLSVGQDDSFYTNLFEEAPRQLAMDFLASINDLTLRPDLLRKHLGDEVVYRSLLRNVSVASVTGQFTRIVHGEARLLEFDVKYLEPEDDVELNFKVSPRSLPPTNIHVLIGRNGSGKTRLLKRMADALLNRHGPTLNHFQAASSDTPIEELLAGVGRVSFSAFDRDRPLPVDQSPGLSVFDVGLRKLVRERLDDGRVRRTVALKDYDEVLADMGSALYLCTQKSLDRWHSAIETLESDPVFADMDARSLAEGISPRGLAAAARRRFKLLSSGHQVVLLTVTSLVAHVEERTLVLLDEPEAHLHPPLLSALIRTLSEILSDRNAFAIVATHSPVILQEVPSRCAHLVRRSGDALSTSTPRIETFGENVGVLTREVFGLEVEGSGFNRMLTDVVLGRGLGYQEVLSLFEGRLGSEALALVSSILVNEGQSLPAVELEF